MLSATLRGRQVLADGHSDSRRITLEAAPDADTQLRRRVLNFLVARDLGTKLPEIRVRGGVVTVKGRVPTPEHRRLVCLCCQHVAGVLRVIDNLEIGSCLCESRHFGEPNETAIAPRQLR